MQSHDGEELAAFCEYECDIADVLETGVAEWRRQGGGYADEDHGRED